MIEAKHVSYIYTPGGAFERRAVDDVCFTVEEGTFCGLIGQTGSGKTTLMQMLAGLLRPTGGSIEIDGIDMHDRKTHASLRGKVGLVFQYPEYQLFGETVLEDVMFGPKNMGLGEEKAKERALWALETVGVRKASYEKSPFALSGGQKRRAAIAGVLAMKPSVLILDEPTAGLDPAGRNEILSYICRLHEAEKTTVFLVSHSMEDMARVAERILVMHDGHLVADGNVAEIFKEEEELRRIGLDVPEITGVVRELRKNGMPIHDEIYTPEGAAEAILAVWRDKKCSEI